MKKDKKTILIALPASLHKTLKMAAAKREMTMRDVIVKALTKELKPSRRQATQ